MSSHPSCSRSAQEIYQSNDGPAASASEWYALRVKSKCEKMVSGMLRAKGYQEFLPLYRVKHLWSDRTKELDLPLFPGYLFCRFDVNKRLPILITPGVVSVMGAGKVPLAISDAEIAAIQGVVDSGLPVTPWPGLTVGSRVLIEAGPLAGIEGIALDVYRKYRLIVSVPLLQRAVAVEIDREWVRPLASA